MRKRSTSERGRRFAPLGWWTIRRSTGVGVVAGLCSILLWPVFAAWQEPFHIPYLAALAVTLFCGLSILAISLADRLFRPARGESVRPIRIFDVALGILLTLPPLWALPDLVWRF
jgi:hypothetical protein